MTNKQAIETIKMAIAEVEWNYPMEYAIAFEKAVKSLEKDRKRAKYYKRKYLKERYKTMTKQQAIDFALTEIRCTLKEQKSLQEKIASLKMKSTKLSIIRILTLLTSTRKLRICLKR